MIIKKYDIELIRLTNDKIELVRKWRNEPKIKKHMFFDGEITKNMQQKWFTSIDNISNHYFLIHYKNEAVGLIHLSDLDFEKKDCFSGLFIYEDSFIGTDIPVRASLCLLDYFFETEWVYTVFAKTKVDNLVALNYNQSLGFEIAGDTENGKGYLMRLTKEDYEQKTASLKKAIGKEKGEVIFDLTNEVELAWSKKINHFVGAATSARQSKI